MRDYSYFTLESRLWAIQKAEKLRKEGQSYSFGIFLKATDELIVNVTLSEVLPAPRLRSCYIGYYLEKEHNGKGYMTEPVRLAVKFAFDELKLHRIEAGVM
ncbi:MAG: GNAT family protein, partial [Thermoactinomyces sp.]